MHAKINDRTGQFVVFDLWVTPQTNGFHEFIYFSLLLQIDRLQLTAVYCNRRGGVKTIPRKTPFSQCENLQHLLRNSHIQDVNTHENNNWRLVSALSLFVRSVCSLLLVLSSSVDQFLAHMIDHTVAQVCALFVSSSSPCLMRTLSGSLSDLSIYLTFLLFIPSIFLHFPLPFTFLFLDVVDYNHAHGRWGAGSPGQEELLHTLRIASWKNKRAAWLHSSAQVSREWKHSCLQRLCDESPTTTSSQRLMSSSPRSPWPTNGPSVRRSSMRAEDEPITLKEKACRPVCRRRQWVMIEQGNPLFAVTQVTRKVTKFRGNSEREQISTLLDRQREQLLAGLSSGDSKNTNSRPITTEEVFKSWMKRSNRSKKNFIALMQTNDVDTIINFFMNRQLKQKTGF